MTSPGPEWTSGSLAALIAQRCESSPDVPFLWVADQGPWTLGALGTAAAAAGRRLASDGVRAGDSVIVRVGNSAEFLPALAAVWLCGATGVLVHPRATERDVADARATTGARAILTAADVDLDAAGPGLTLADVPRVDSASAAVVLLTSGSTGRPKGVPLGHEGAWAMLRTTVSAFRSDTAPAPEMTADRTPNLVAQPLTHTAGLVRLLFCLYVGRGLILLPKFDAAQAHAAVLWHGIRQLTLAPAMLRMLLELPDDATLGDVRYVSSGTAPLPASLREQFETRFGVPVLQTYGQTEAFGAVASERAPEVLAGKRRPGSVGRALPGVEIRIVDADGQAAPAGESGEITVRSAGMATRYVAGDAGGDGAGTGSPVRDGWLYTGDIGYLDEDGYLYLTGRRRSLIICGGFNVFPEELEAALSTAGLHDTVAVGLPDERLGEIPVVVYEAPLTEDEVLARVRDLLAPFKRPRRAVRAQRLPRTPLGKPDRPAARELALSALAAPAAHPERTAL
jgi:long-chain acyl-CoA synthetase